MEKRLIREETRDALILIAPLMLLLFIFILYPVFSNFYYSFTKWNGVNAPEWIGFKNFQKMVRDIKFWHSLKNLGILILYIPAAVFIPLAISAVLREGLTGWAFFKAVLYLPTVIGYVLLGILFSVLFNLIGPFNQMFARLGLETMAEFNWLGSTKSAIHVLGFLFVIWTKLGFGCIYFLAAMSAINVTLYDAAKIDGAGWWQTFFNVTVPGVSFAVQFFTVLLFIEVFARMYSFIYTLTYGGPGFATYTLEFGIYMQGFKSFKMGYASSWAVILFFLCAVIAVMQIRLIRRGER